jgi:mannose-6-phosphate isomerase-like protein (cupin superfamily)
MKSDHWIHQLGDVISVALIVASRRETWMSAPRPVIAAPGAPAFSAAGPTLVVREWSEPGPTYLHVHRSDDEAWYVLAGVLRFRFLDGEVEAPAGSTVFVPAGVAHSYSASDSARYLIFLTPKLDRLIDRLHRLEDPSELVATLAAFDTVIVESPGRNA